MAGPIVYYFSSITKFVFAKECDTVKLVEGPGLSGRGSGFFGPRWRFTIAGGNSEHVFAFHPPWSFVHEPQARNSGLLVFSWVPHQQPAL